MIHNPHMFLSSDEDSKGIGEKGCAAISKADISNLLEICLSTADMNQTTTTSGTKVGVWDRLVCIVER